MKNRPFSKLLINLIEFYQKTISPDHGVFSSLFPHGFCRYYPSCSEYTKQSIEQHGFFSGLWFGIKRISRCTPFHKPKVDLVAEKEKIFIKD